MKILFDILVFLSISSVLIPIFFSIKYYRAFNLELKALFLLLLISFLCDVISLIFAFNGIHNAIIMNLFSLFHGILAVFIIYKSLFTGSQIVKKVYLAIYYLITAISIISLFKHDSFENSDLATNLLFGIFIIIGCLFFYYFLLKEMVVESLRKYYFFWIITAFFLSKCLSLFISISEDYITDVNNGAYFLWVIQMISNIGFNLLAAIGICQIKHK